MRTQKMSEANEQETLFMWAAYKSQYWPELLSMYHIPNGGHRDAAEAAHLKRLGVKAGVPDICLPVARNGFHGLYIEMKAGKNKATDLQKKWIEILTNQGYKAVVCVGWIEARDIITDYLQKE